MNKKKMNNKYKPTSLEENYSNIVYMRNIFCNQINSYIYQYNNIVRIYTSPYLYNQFLCANLINPYLTYEGAIRELAYSILGFTVELFERISYALDYWRVKIKNKKRNITNSEYDYSIQLLNQKNKITSRDKEILLNYRIKRNYYTHYGRIIFCRYIFDNSYTIYNLLLVIENLLSDMNVNQIEVEKFLVSQEDFIIEMEKVLSNLKNQYVNFA